jgi:glycerophosphoryl diester phosphodiesterase
MIATMPSPIRAQLLIIGHRGASFDAPENTLASFKLAFEQNADGIEGDFYLTKDGRIVCIHDKRTKRTAGGVDLDVTSSTLEELRRLDFGAWKNPKYAGERIPTLEEVLAVVPAGKLLCIEIKCGPEILPALEETLSKSRVSGGQIRIISFNADVIAAAKQRLPRIKAHWISDYKQDKKTNQWSPTRETILKTLKGCRADGYNSQANFTFFDKGLVDRLKSMGLETQAWTVDKPADAKRLKEMGVFAITTNRPRDVRAALK